MIPEHVTAVLTRDIPEHGLVAGDTGIVVSVMHDAADESRAVGYLLEIFAADGSTIDVIDVPADAVRPGSASEVYHVRVVAAE